jgi:toxin ParE1/3/4
VSLPVELSAWAEEDIELQRSWYARHAGVDVASEYLDALWETVEQISRRPDVGRKRHFSPVDLRNVRSTIFTRHFKVHLLFYRIYPEKIEILRVMHGMRDLPRRLLEPPGED